MNQDFPEFLFIKMVHEGHLLLVRIAMVCELS